jgi:ABC-type lipoprotein release transport system permease subunit
MKIIKMAGRSYLGYRLKAASILIFTSIAFTLILGGTNLLYNSFSLWFERSTDFDLPRFFVSAKPGFDFDGDFGIRDMALKDADRAAIESRLSKDFVVGDIAFMFSQLSEKGKQENSSYAFIVGVDFDKLGAIFPFFKGKLDPASIAEYKKAPLALLNERSKELLEIRPGTELVLASQDYYRDFNAMKLTVRDIIPDKLVDGDFMRMPTAFVDISQLKRLFGLPEGYGPACVLIPRRRVPILSLGNAALTSKIESITQPLGLGLRDASNMSRNMSSSFGLYRNVIGAFILVLALVLCLSVSSNLFMSFQDRRADFGLYKAFGCGNGRIFLMVLAENAFGIALPFAFAFLVNTLLWIFLKPFPIMGGFFTLYPGFTDYGVIAISLIALIVCLASVIRSYRYLARLEPVSIMREE